MKLGIKKTSNHTDPITGKYSAKIYNLKNKEKIKERKKEYYLKNKENLEEKRKQYYLKNKENYIENAKKHYLKNRDIILKKMYDKRRTPEGKLKAAEKERKYNYGLLIGQFDDMIKNQNNKCTTCMNEFNENLRFLKPHVDHDHQTGKVRSLLCGYCNFALGHIKENINTLSNLINYLKKHKNDGQLEEMGIKGKAREIEEHNRLSESIQKEIERVNIEVKKSENKLDKLMKVLKEKARRYDLMRFALRKTENKV